MKCKLTAICVQRASSIACIWSPIKIYLRDKKLIFSILWKLAFLFFYLVLYSCSEREHLVNTIQNSFKRNHAINNQKVTYFFLTRASIWTRGPRWAVRQSSVKEFAQNILTHETVILFCHQHCYLYWCTNISLHISHFHFLKALSKLDWSSRKFPAWNETKSGFPERDCWLSTVDSFARDP